MRFPKFLVAAMFVLAAPAAAQLSLPGVGGTLGRVTGSVDDLTARSLRAGTDAVDRLAEIRIDRLTRLVRDNSETIELDVDAQPARRGELLLVAASVQDVASAEQSGFRTIAREEIEGLDLAVVRLAVPTGDSLARAQKRLRKLLPDATISADQLYFAATTASTARQRPVAATRATQPAPSVPVGVIDGASASSIPVTQMRGFAGGAPRASDHGSAVVSLTRHAGATDVFVADVYGSDPAGGNALAIVRALGWLLASDVRVISISLVGPRNAVLEKAIGAVHARGAIVVAAVGNDGPAAPPAYPASYPGVLAVTAVDGRDRALIEAGRALHLDYAAPGADMLAANKAGHWSAVRGTSFAVPLVAARAARAMAARGSNWRAGLDHEARDLGRKGPDPVFGRGLICGTCRRAK